MTDLRAPKHLVLNGFPLQDSNRGRGIGRYTDKMYFEILQRWERQDPQLTSDFSQISLVGSSIPNLREVFDNQFQRVNYVSVSKKVEKLNILKYFYYKWTVAPALNEFLKKSATPTIYFLPRHQILTSPYADYTVTMVHDFAPLKTHRWGRVPIMDPLLSIEYDLYLKELAKSDLIVTNSVDTSNTVSQYLGRENDTTAILLGNIFDNTDPAVYLKKPSPLNEPYFFYYSGFDFNKNIPGVIKAFALFIRKHEDTNHTKLVFSGGTKEARSIIALAKKEGILENIQLMDHLTDEELALYAVHSLGLFRLSFIEGCGLPEIEVMSLGVPVISADIGAVREMVGQFALLADPKKPETAEPLLYQAAKKRVPAEQLRKGMAHAKEFTWAKTAAKTVDSIIDFVQTHKPKREQV